MLLHTTALRKLNDCVCSLQLNNFVKIFTQNISILHLILITRLLAIRWKRTESTWKAASETYENLIVLYPDHQSNLKFYSYFRNLNCVIAVTSDSVDEWVEMQKKDVLSKKPQDGRLGLYLISNHLVFIHIAC